MKTHNLYFEDIHTNYVFHFILLHVIKFKLGMYDLQVSVMCVTDEQMLLTVFNFLILFPVYVFRKSFFKTFRNTQNHQ